MLGHSAAFDATIVTDHIAVAEVDIIQDDRVVLQPVPISGSVSATRLDDRMRTMTADFGDQSLVPLDMNSIVAPYGTRIRFRKGVRISTTDTRAAFYGTKRPWTPSGLSTGQLNGVTVGPDGSLQLGP